MRMTKVFGTMLMECVGAGFLLAQTAIPPQQFSPRPQPTQAVAALPVQTPAQTPAAQAPAVPAYSPQAPGPTPASIAAQQLFGSSETGIEPYYVLKNGDTVDVIFRYTPEFNDEVVIGPDGRASFKSVGDIRVAGRTVPELQRIIVTGSTDKLVNPDVAVSVKDFERPNVVVAGEVQLPMKIELRKPTTVLQAILMAGGPKEDAALGRVLLFRRIDSDTAEVHVLKLSKYDPKTRAANNMLLEPGDAILVRHDHLTKVERYVKLANIGFYLNPFGNNGIF